MSVAATELRGSDETADVGVSVDGTWQRKGFTSMNGVVTAISVDSGKVVDVSILSKSCKGCVRMKPVEKSDRARYELWKASHKCSLNYTGSSPNMEKVGAQTMFGRSVDKHGLYYTSFYGDGDSKAFPSAEKIYGHSKVIKSVNVSVTTRNESSYHLMHDCTFHIANIWFIKEISLTKNLCILS